MKARYIIMRYLGWLIICIGFGLMFTVEGIWGHAFVVLIVIGMFVSDYGIVSREKYEALREDFESLTKYASKLSEEQREKSDT